MFSRERITRFGISTNPRCTSIDDAIRIGERLNGVTHSLAVIRAKHAGELDTSRTMVPVLDQLVEVHTSGCTTDHESDYEDKRVIIGSCAKTNKCAKCILNLTDGERLLESMRPFEIESLHS